MFKFATNSVINLLQNICSSFPIKKFCNYIFNYTVVIINLCASHFYIYTFQGTMPRAQKSVIRMIGSISYENNPKEKI